MKTRKTDNEKIKELIALSEANPDMEIIPMVNFEICVSDDYDYWMGSIGRIEKDFVYLGDTVLMGMDKIYDHLYDEIDNDEFYAKYATEDVSIMTIKQIEGKKALGEITEKIIVYIETPE